MNQYSEVRKLLEQKGQEHLLNDFSSLDEAERRNFLSTISTVDWSIFEDKPVERKGDVEPLAGISRKELKARYQEFESAGAKLLKEGKVGAVMLAGGQGTRLGSSAPKGAYNIGLTKPLYIFECLIKNLREVTEKYGVRVPLFIMTSDKTDQATRAFLKEHAYFGYPEEDICFFVQDMAPCTDLSGKILLEAEGKLALSPNGNGGWYSSMMRAGLTELMRARGVEWLNVFAVDNVLQRIADPVFIGATCLSGEDSGAKLVKKVSPEERVGVLCTRGGKPDIIEYYELNHEMEIATDEAGELLYANGVILNYLFRVSALDEVASRKIPVHRVKKKVPFYDGEKTVFPQTENAYKYETLILDFIHLLKGCCPFEVDREREFAPIKNATGMDSVESARVLLQKNGVEL